MLTNLCYFIIYILEACILWQYCKNIFTPSHTRQTRFFVLSFCYLLLFLGSLFQNFWINFGAFLALNFVYLFFMYEIKCLTAFFHSFLITMIMVLSELGFFSILSHYIPDFYNTQTYFHNVVTLTIPSKLLYFALLQYISQYIKKKKTRELSSDKNTLFLNIIPLLSGFIALVLAAVCMHVRLSFYLNIMITISVLLLLTMNVFLVWFHTAFQEKSQEFLEMQLLLQKESDTVKYFDALHKQDEKQKILIHDIRKHLFSIAELNEKKETQKVADYIHQIIQSSDMQTSIRVSDNNLLNTILFRVKQQCKEQDTTLIADIRAGCLNFISEYDLTALFSNLLDNAVEATQNVSCAFIEISITSRNNDSIVITMINSCNKDPFINNHHLSTTKKEKHTHGYGMKSIERVIKKYSGNSQLYYNKENRTFHTIIILKRKMNPVPHN